MISIDDALRIALEAHYGQKDRDGNPVILHPLTVGLAGKTDAEKIAGFLHDVIEDTDLTIDDLRKKGVDEEILLALDLLTHKESDTYREYVEKIATSGNCIAKAVKINDLTHNIKRGREHGLHDLVKRHEKALERLTT